METIDFNTSRIYFKEQKWFHGKNNTKIDISNLNKTQKLQATVYLEGILEETKAKLLDKSLENERLEEYKILIKTINIFLVELR